MERALIHGPITKITQHHPIFLAVFDRPTQPGGQRNMRADNGMAAEEIFLPVKKVHRPALTVRTAGLFAIEFRKQQMNIHAPRNGVAMITVGGNDIIRWAHRRNTAYRHRFLADI